MVATVSASPTIIFRNRPFPRSSTTQERSSMNLPTHLFLDAEIAKRRLQEEFLPASEADSNDR
jgi:hypothetical protein